MKSKSLFFFLALTITGLSPCVEAQDRVILAGRATHVRLLEENARDSVFEIELELTLRNSSSTAAIFYRDEFLVIGEQVFTQTKDKQAELLYRRDYPSSIDLSPV